MQTSEMLKKTSLEFDWEASSLAKLLDFVATVMGAGKIVSLMIRAGDPIEIESIGDYSPIDWELDVKATVFNVPIEEVVLPVEKCGTPVVLNRVFDRAKDLGLFLTYCLYSDPDALKRILGTELDEQVGFDSLPEESSVFGVTLLRAPEELVDGKDLVFSLALHPNFPVWKSLKLVRVVLDG